jgi:hypothetical protein
MFGLADGYVAMAIQRISPVEDPLFRIVTADGCGSLNSSIEREAEKAIGDREYNAAIDGAESFLLALACEGLNLSDDPRAHNAVRTMLDAAGNDFSDDTPLISDRQCDALRYLLTLATQAVAASEYDEDRAHAARDKRALWLAGKFINNLPPA